MTMLRYNEGKALMSLVPSSFFEAIFNSAYEIGTVAPTLLIRQVGQVLTFGAAKYAAHNWRKGGQWSSVMNSGLRHLIAMFDGEELDPESGLPHSGHLGCNIAFLLEFVHTSNGEDDRHKTIWTRALEADAEPSLIWVLDALLQFNDGGGVDCLREAAWELARYVEFANSVVSEPEPDSGVPAWAFNLGPIDLSEPMITNGTLDFPFSFPLNSVVTH